MVLTRILIIYACAPEAFSRIRGGPGLVVSPPMMLESMVHGSIPSFVRFRRITVRQRPHNGCIRGYLKRPPAVFSGFYRRRNSSCFILLAFPGRGTKERLIYFNRAISVGPGASIYLSLSNTRILAISF